MLFRSLAWKLRQDQRVISMEQFNFRYASVADFEQIPQFASIDVSFISLSLILPALKEILAEEGQVVALIKPQFEAGREQIGKNGIVKDKKVHVAVLEKVTSFMVELGFSVGRVPPVHELAAGVEGPELVEGVIGVPVDEQPVGVVEAPDGRSQVEIGRAHV